MGGVYAALPEIASEKKIRAIGGRPANAGNSSPLMRSARHPDCFGRTFTNNFIRAARFNVTRIFQFCAPQFSIFEAMRAGKKPPHIREETSNDEPDVR
jgi:hypothetical protein